MGVSNHESSLYDRKTVVYTDASLPAEDKIIAGGLGVVIVQEDRTDRKAYPLTQRNYHIVRLELVALILPVENSLNRLARYPFRLQSPISRAIQIVHEPENSSGLLLFS